MSSKHSTPTNDARNGIQRLKTGVLGLDSLIGGGLPEGGFHLLVGGPGTGKTLLSVQAVCNMAAVSTSECRIVYVTFEEASDYLKRNQKSLGFSLDDLEREDKVKLLDLYTIRGEGLDGLLSYIVEAAKEIGAKVVVIDSLTAFLAACNTPFEIRTFVKRVGQRLAELEVTVLATLSVSSLENIGLEGFVADSVMYLENHLQGYEYVTRFAVLKMRGTAHSRRFHRVIISSKEGLRITSAVTN